MTISPEVSQVISKFVSEGRSFISLDVYCKLGQHFDSSCNPIHDQVREAYSTPLMANYLCRWANLKLEGGGYANVWKYYVPKSTIVNYKIKNYNTIAGDTNSLILTKEMLGHFSLLECDMSFVIREGSILLSLKEDKRYPRLKIGNEFAIAWQDVIDAELSSVDEFNVSVQPNQIEITKSHQESQ